MYTSGWSSPMYEEDKWMNEGHATIVLFLAYIRIWPVDRTCWPSRQAMCWIKRVGEGKKGRRSKATEKDRKKRQTSQTNNEKATPYKRLKMYPSPLFTTPLPLLHNPSKPVIYSPSIPSMHPFMFQTHPFLIAGPKKKKLSNIFTCAVAVEPPL